MKDKLLKCLILLLILCGCNDRRSGIRDEAFQPSEDSKMQATPYDAEATAAAAALVSTPTETAVPELTATPTVTPTVTARAPSILAAHQLTGPNIDHEGVSFRLPAALGTVVVSYPPQFSQTASFDFVQENFCHSRLACLAIESVPAYAAGFPAGEEILAELEQVIEEGSGDFFPVLGNDIVMHTQTKAISFQNGRGIRAVVNLGQVNYFANNETLFYDFRGLTNDGQYFISLLYPLDAPLLPDTAEFAENTNITAVPVPPTPESFPELDRAIDAYNEIVAGELDQLETAAFTPDLALLDELVGSLAIAP